MKHPAKRQPSIAGFTIVELVVVIVVMGILATITVASYGNWRERTVTNQIKSDLNGVATAMENVRNFSNGYPSSLPSNFTPTEGIQVSYVNGSTTTYCVDASSIQYPEIQYHMTTTTGNSAVNEGSC